MFLRRAVQLNAQPIQSVNDHYGDVSMENGQKDSGQILLAKPRLKSRGC